jgi:hypothetical protein
MEGGLLGIVDCSGANECDKSNKCCLASSDRANGGARCTMIQEQRVSDSDVKRTGDLGTGRGDGLREGRAKERSKVL